MKVAITAVSGQLGSEIAQQLVGEIGAENIVGTARTLSKAENLGITVLPGDYNNRSDFDKALNGDEGNSTFDTIVKSNRQTEQDIRESGLEWSIGRNGLYIEPDVEYIEIYIKEGEIANCAGDGLCSYTTRSELAYAYVQLTAYLNAAFGTSLVYEEMTPEAYLTFQQNVNGEFLGKVIAGIYIKIRNGEFNIQSDFEAAAGRKHLEWKDYFISLNQS